MRKRLALLSTIFGSMFLLCVAVTGVAAMVDPRTLAVSVSVFLVGMLIIFVQYHYITAGTSRYLHQLGEEVHALQTEASIGHPLALTVVSDTGEIVWYNRKAEQLLDGSSTLQLYGRMISDFIGNTDFRQPTPEKGFGVRIGGRQYSMYANEYDSGSETEKLFALYFVDDHDLKHYTDLYFKTRPAVMRIMVDNYDELVQNARESDKTQVLSEIDYQITQFVEKYGGVVSQVEKDRYNAVFEDKFMQQIIQNRLDILDTIRKIEISDRVPCTLSIGIGREAPSISEADEMARQALEMAQGRGGDQAAVRTKNGYDFYGGLSKGVEKRTKVKTRIVAQALSELIGIQQECHSHGTPVRGYGLLRCGSGAAQGSDPDGQARLDRHRSRQEHGGSALPPGGGEWLPGVSQGPVRAYGRGGGGHPAHRGGYPFQDHHRIPGAV